MAVNATGKGGVGASAAAGASLVGGKNNNSIMRAALPSREEMLRTETFLQSRLKIGNVVNKQHIVEEAAGQTTLASMVLKQATISENVQSLYIFLVIK